MTRRPTSHRWRLASVSQLGKSLDDPYTHFSIMVQLIVTDHLRSACQLALESRELPASWPSRAEIEEAAIPPTKKELQERQLAAASAKKDSETRVSDANNRDADRKDAQGPTKSQDKTSETQEAPTVSVPPPKTISHKAVKDLSDFLLSNVCKGRFSCVNCGLGGGSIWNSQEHLAKRDRNSIARASIVNRYAN